jgi:hypothetical protein
VIGVGIGHKNFDPKTDLCVHFYVQRKLEPDAVPQGSLIKKTIGSVQTDVIETRRFVAFQSPRPAPGFSIGLDYTAPNVDPTITGTLSAFVKINGDYYVLGSNHTMMVNGRVPAGKEILFKLKDKFTDPKKQVFATADVFVPLSQNNLNYVDCALAKVDKKDRKRIKIQFPERIVTSGNPIPPEVGMEVTRIDDTERATGVITSVTAYTPIDYRFGTYKFDDLVKIQGKDGPFAKPGDSGALLVDLKTKRPTAIVIGGSSRFTIACSLETALTELKTVVNPNKGLIASMGKTSSIRLLF